ncbi:ubiquitin carboxyl-terminal hydrolase family protein [Tasmannia lanceolata]|uniref:ubiquitin carboxyl-terminal hydrolase family protein n=1 Tax=Tasmannia lanceolata TaxID=3420 RepID=UPI0040643106
MLFSRFSTFPLQPRIRSHLYIQSFSFVEARIKWIRDRGLDHAVEKEKNLKPLLSLKNFIKSEPSKSLPVSLAADNKTNLGLPIRAIEFIRKYPSIFSEFPSPSDSRRPHVRLTPETLILDEDEQKVYENCRRESADRLLKLLMLTPDKKLPLFVVDRLKWDLGLPNDYVKTLIPEFPDYFQISSFNPGSNELALELVCWIKELAVSAMERGAMDSGEYKKGMPHAFALQFSSGFELEKKVKKWVEEWQKLPYISPYEDARHLPPKSDLREKWIVGVLHEIFHLFVPKKAEKDTVLLLGEYMGLRSAFKRAFSQHPGIFYISNKIRTSTIVLKEAYKRDLLVQKHPLMGIRYQYIHLMHKGKEAASDAKSGRTPRVKEEAGDDSEEGEEEEEEEEEAEEEDEEEEEVLYGSSDESSDDEEDEDDQDARERILISRGTRQIRQQPIEMKRSTRSSFQANSSGRHLDRTGNVQKPFSRKTELNKGSNAGVRSPGRLNYQKSSERRLIDRRT